MLLAICALSPIEQHAQKPYLIFQRGICIMIQKLKADRTFQNRCSHLMKGLE
jgi:hypothetical protein